MMDSITERRQMVMATRVADRHMGPSPDRVASRYLQAGPSEWLQWIVQPFAVLKKHHRKFVNGPLDDAADAVIKDLAPILVKAIVEQEVDEDVQEYLDGAQEGRFESIDGQLADPEPNTSEDYRSGYGWGYANAQSWDGKGLPAGVKRRVVQEQLKEFRGEITEQVVIAGLEKAWATVNPREIFNTVMRAVKQHGWKIGIIYGIGEIIENFVIPAALTHLTGVPVPPGSTGWIPLNDLVFAAIVKRLGGAAAVNDFQEDGHLDWYEAQYGMVRIAGFDKQAGGLGDCYEANGKYFMDHALFPGSEKNLHIIHGEVTGQGPLEGVKYGHCWVEDGNTVIDKSNGRNVRMPKAAYYAAGHIKENDNLFEYGPEDFRRNVLQYEHWGPWDLHTSTGL